VRKNKKAYTFTPGCTAGDFFAVNWKNRRIKFSYRRAKQVQNNRDILTFKEICSMKATGIVRRIDDLGRIVIPKEIRRSFRIKEGDPLEIFTNADGEVIFKKYSPIGELSQFAGQYAEVLHKNGCSPVVITDNDHVVAAAGVSKREVMERRVTKALEDVMDARTPRIAKAPSECLQAIEGYDRPAEVAYPIVYGGDVSGTVLLLQGEDGAVPDETQIRLIQVGAAFLGRQME